MSKTTRVFDVLMRRAAVVAAAADAEWARWKRNPQDRAALRRHGRLVARKVRLVRAATEDLDQRTTAALRSFAEASWQGGAA